MNYQKIYNSIIARSAGRKKLKVSDPDFVYYEKHHIIPRCVGGNNDLANLAYLTAEEHWVAHLLLVKIYPGQAKLVFACQAMSMCSKNNQRTTNKLFGWIREKYATETSARRKGQAISDEQKAKISKSLKGRPVPHQQGKNNAMHRPGVKEKALLARKGKPSQQRRCKEQFTLEHTETKEVFTGTRRQIKEYAKVLTPGIYALIHGHQQTSNKWKLLKEPK